MQIQVAHALCERGCSLISHAAYKHLVTIEACYNCPRSPLRELCITFTAASKCAWFDNDRGKFDTFITHVIFCEFYLHEVIRYYDTSFPICVSTKRNISTKIANLMN